ncbi:synaptogyrin-4 [Mixophyes fleayi]|uniref:synaptogyrin-4 n=1 Tax=Mixophyes fleayi TaxID=3061075 RepID=UPI003F4DEF2F
MCVTGVSRHFQDSLTYFTSEFCRKKMQALKCFPSLGQITSKPLFEFILRPRTITRIVSWIFSIIVCGSIISGGFQNLPSSSKLNCVLNENPAACGYGIGIGIVAGLLCLLFLLLDISEPYILNHYMQKIILVSDTLCSVICAALWFIGFCFLAHQWTLSIPNAYPMGTKSAHITIVFSFFSIPCWVILSFMAFMRFRITTFAGYKRSVEEAILPIINRMSSSSNDQVKILQSSGNMTPCKMPDQNMISTFQY